jgi:hypothetical protein
MVKKPKSSIDEEAVIRRRDGVVGNASDELLDSNTKRALADARLRALAFALRSGESRRAAADEIEDAELVAYLLDSLPEQRRIALEQALRGNARAFGRLMTLRTALSSQTDKRDRQRADDLVRKVSRHTAGHLDIRRFGEILQFRDATQPRPASHVARWATFPNKALRSQGRRAAALAHRDMPELRQTKRPRLQWGEQTEGMLRDVLERARRDLLAGTDLVGKAQQFLARWWVISRREESREGGAISTPEAQSLRERMTELLRELEFVANRINDELGDVTSTAAAVFPRGPLVESYPSAELFKENLTETRPLEFLLPRDGWADTFDLEAGHWVIHLAGTATTPRPQLTIALNGNQVGRPSIDPFVTLVRPMEGFDTVNLDSSGSGKFALPFGDSVILLQSADDVWELRLSFRDEDGA